MTGIMTIIGLLSAPATHKRDVKMGTAAKQVWMGAQFWLSPAKVKKNAVGICIDWRQEAVLSKN